MFRVHYYELALDQQGASYKLGVRLSHALAAGGSTAQA
jgi:hypothetical protein